MRLSLRSKLIAIVATAAFAFIVLIVSSALIANRAAHEMTIIEQRLLPKVELGPRLEVDFERLRRGLQDAVAAYDAEGIGKTRELRDRFQDDLAVSRGAVDPAQADRLARAMDDYYGTAVDASRRLLAGETGEALVGALSEMQTKHVRVTEALRATTSFDRRELTNAFAAASQAQTTATRVRLTVSAVCLIFVVALSLWLGRGVMKSIFVLTTGLRRFGRGDFTSPIPGLGDDDLGEVATQANQMATSLDRLAQQRDRADWLKNGQVGLAEELRGELELPDVASRAIQYVARYLDARVGALYDLEQGTLRLIGQFAFSEAAASRGAAASFGLGQGLVGQAALREDIMVVGDPPPGYLQVRSGLGASAVREIVLVPIVRAGRVSGVLELGFFSPWSERAHELVLSVREMIAIAIEVARARTATRRLLAETQRQAQLLVEQEEELRARNEELQSQQEDMQKTNVELTQQTEELENQRRILQDRNIQLDEARAELERKAAELTTVNSYKSQFLANMSHELRTPLNSMLLLSNLLAVNESGTLTDKQIEYARTIYGAGRDLLALINQVLDLAKIEAGRFDIHVAPVPLRDLVASLERVFLPLAADRKLRLLTEVAPGVPATIMSDRPRIEQILNNLLANAIKFTEKGQVTLRVDRPEPPVVFQREGLSPQHTLAFSVSDTGVGIAPADHQRIFAPFEQVDAAPDRRYGGTGLGLNIARELAQLLGGELQLKSNLGAGSTFVCYLPDECPTESTLGQPRPWSGSLALPALLPPPLPSPQSLSAPPVSPRDPLRAATLDEDSLLIIEDDQRFAQALGDVIEGQGLKYRIARDGPTGLRLARDRAHRPVAIILDVMLPGMDGWAVMNELRSDPATSAIPVHFISAVDGAEHGAALGAVGYLTKPTTHRDLIRVVQSLVPEAGRRNCRILIVEENPGGPDSLATKLAGETLELEQVGSAREALELLGRVRFACMVLDLSLPDMDGLEFLRAARVTCGAETPSVVVYTARALTKVEAQVLEAFTEAVVLKEGSSIERLLDEVRLFVRRLNEETRRRRKAPAALPAVDLRLKGRKLLIADDDMRTLYALAALLRARGVEVLAADNGKVALELLQENPDVEGVLMDMMMPETDGYQAIRAIRDDPRFGALPIIALTAKAMKGDAERCLEAGASEYLAKPIDPEQLVTMLNAALPARTPAQGRS